MVICGEGRVTRPDYNENERKSLTFIRGDKGHLKEEREI